MDINIRGGRVTIKKLAVEKKATNGKRTLCKEEIAVEKKATVIFQANYHS